MSTLLSQARHRVPRFAEPAVQRPLTVVPRRRHRAPRVPFIALVSLVLVLGVGGLLFFNTSMQQASFTATALSRHAATLQAQEQTLKMQLEQLRDPQRVASRAKALGMVPNPTPAFIKLSDGSVLGNPTVAEKGQGMRIEPLPVRKPKELRPDPVVVEPAARARARGRGGNGRDTTAASANEASAQGGKRNQRQRRDAGE